ncbi:type IV toxin-antitoxin system AbiEi family antitoxin domain-containing protein [Nocardioides alcanivorans]|uniref:type IV toxin-antitoxin system AbiEi family antitoxin domain-containing protein n=1 Tax=Nocardioides alcanivorans TaxID=2897352 RepID=UPI001F330777|nr:type IV toxin-antitoxin system AbiEi family antitoxin domain-containing protein [Nocardioides alcanivorans]
MTTLWTPRAAEAGYISRPEVLALGFDDAYIQRRLRAGDWTRIRNGAYALTSDWRQRTAIGQHLVRARSVQRHARGEVALSHTTALLAHGIPVWEPDLDEVHVTGARSAGRRESGVRHHRGTLLAGDVVDVGQDRATAPERAILEYATRTDLEHGLVAADGALHEGLATPEKMRKQAERMTHWPGAVILRLVLALMDSRVESPGESRVRHLCWVFGLPMPVPQFEVFDAAGRLVARLDLAWPRLGLYLEFDGRVKYAAFARPGEDAIDVVMREKGRQQVVGDLLGWDCIRVVWSEFHRPAQLAARIAARLERVGWCR